MGKSGPGLQVINAGYPKTGTKTIHEALRLVFSAQGLSGSWKCLK